MKSETTNWNGKDVGFRPGKIYVCAKIGFNEAVAENRIRSYDRSIEIKTMHQPGIFEIFLSPRLTLKVANDMIASHEFRFIELERTGYF